MKKIKHSRLVILLLFVSAVSALTCFYLFSRSDTHPGSSVYLSSCANCHGEKGAGFRKLYPPLKHSAFLSDQISDLPCLIRQGIQGSIMTNKGTYNQLMPPITTISEPELTNLVDYLNKRWGSKRVPITPEKIDSWLTQCR